MDVTELALEWDKAFVLSLGYADGDPAAFDKWIHQYMQWAPGQWRGKMLEETPTAVSDGLRNENRSGEMFWYVGKDGTVTGVSPDLEIEGIYVIPAGSSMPQVKDYKVPMIPGR
jgi:hypothetical protein